MNRTMEDISEDLQVAYDAEKALRLKHDDDLVALKRAEVKLHQAELEKAVTELSLMKSGIAVEALETELEDYFQAEEDDERKMVQPE